MIDEAFHPMFELSMGGHHYFSVLGRALFTAQHLEMNCRAIIGFLHMRDQVIQHGSSILEDPIFKAEINRICKNTLGKYVRRLNNRFTLSDDVSFDMATAVTARNELVHSVAMGVTDPLDSELEERIDEIRELVVKIATADKNISALLHILNRDPLPTRHYWESYEDNVAAWVTGEAY
jgi:hypothetical protein